MHPSRDPDATLEFLGRAAEAVLAADTSAADDAMRAIAFEPPASGPRRGVSNRVRARVFARDHFTCCYCGQKTIPSVVLQCFSELWPVEFPNHPHGKTSETHPAYWTVMSSLEHLEAGTRGGGWTDEANLACACWPCNQAKGNSASTDRFSARAPADTSWDGMIGLYPSLWVSAGRPKPTSHAPWLRAWHGAVPTA